MKCPDCGATLYTNGVCPNCDTVISKTNVKGVVTEKAAKAIETLTRAVDGLIKAASE